MGKIITWAAALCLVCFISVASVMIYQSNELDSRAAELGKQLEVYNYKALRTKTSVTAAKLANAATARVDILIMAYKSMAWWRISLRSYALSIIERELNYAKATLTANNLKRITYQQVIYSKQQQNRRRL